MDARRRRLLFIGAGSLTAVVAALVAYRLTRPPALGLERSRVVVACGDSNVGDTHARAKDVVPAGGSVRTGRGSACVSVRASRVCLGANTEVVLGDSGQGGATVDVKRGTVVVAAVEQPVRVTVPSGAFTVTGGTVAVEDADGKDPVVRALDGSASVEPTGKPPVVLAAPDAIGMRDAKKRPSSQAAENEERAVTTIARRWQGTAGAVVTYKSPRGRVEIDGALVGIAPAEVLLDEGQHVLVVRDGPQEVLRETLQLKAGQHVVQGG